MGDYHEGYYTAHTPDGATLSQLVAGYIDIILKKRHKTQNSLVPPGLAKGSSGGLSPVSFPSHTETVERLAPV